MRGPNLSSSASESFQDTSPMSPNSWTPNFGVQSAVLQFGQLLNVAPTGFRGSDLQCLYCSDADGIALSTLLKKAINESPVLLVLCDTLNNVFGYYAPVPWKLQVSGESFPGILKILAPTVTALLNAGYFGDQNREIPRCSTGVERITIYIPLRTTLWSPHYHNVTIPNREMRSRRSRGKRKRVIVCDIWSHCIAWGRRGEARHYRHAASRR